MSDMEDKLSNRLCVMGRGCVPPSTWHPEILGEI